MEILKNEDWYSWVNMMPEVTKSGGQIHVTGNVLTIPELYPYLEKAEPQGINPEILLLNLKTARKPQHPVPSGHVHYSEFLGVAAMITQVQINWGGGDSTLIEKIEKVF